MISLLTAVASTSAMSYFVQGAVASVTIYGISKGARKSVKKHF